MAGAGVFDSMRISSLGFWDCGLIAVAGHEGTVSDERVTMLLQTTQRIVQHANYPVLFVGRIVERDTGRLPCTVPSGQSITYPGETVLFGFAPPARVKVAYPKCGCFGSRFSSQDVCGTAANTIMRFPARSGRPGRYPQMPMFTTICFSVESPSGGDYVHHV